MSEDKKNTNYEEQSFEALMDKLEEVVKALESGDLPLEDAVKKYETGMRLSQACHDKLEDAEKVLTRKMTDQGEEPFDIEEDNNEK